MARSPDYFETPLADRNHVTVADKRTGASRRTILIGVEPARPHSFRCESIDGEAVAKKKRAGSGNLHRRDFGRLQHAIDPYQLELVQENFSPAALLNYCGGAEVIDVIVGADQHVQVFERDPY